MRWKRVAVAGIAAIMGLTTFFGCVGGPDSGSATTLNVSLLTAGLGRDWFDRVAEAFSEKFPEVEFDVNEGSSYDTFYNTIAGNANTNEIDLYFTYGPKYRQYFEGEHKNKNYIEDLSDVYDYTVSGEAKSIGEKMNQTIRESFSYEGKYYAMPWQGMASGIAYDADVFAAHPEWKIPRTTDELAQLADMMTENGLTPFIHNRSGYWSFIIETWWAQYGGTDAYFDFWQAKAPDGSQPSALAYEQPARRAALDALYKCIAPTGNTYAGSNSTSHTDAQTMFFNGAAVMTPNAGWLENEMKKQDFAPGSQNVRLMRTPIISSIADQLSDKVKNAPNRDLVLRQIVDYVDGVAETKPNAEDSDVERIAEARRLSQSSGMEILALVPAYSPAKDMAKEFLKFLYSDEGTQIYADALHILPPWDFSDGRTVDQSGWTGFAQSHCQIQKEAVYIFKPFDYKLYYNTSLMNSFYEYPEAKFTASYEKDRENVTQYWTRETAQFKKDWRDNLIKAGLAAE